MSEVEHHAKSPWNFSRKLLYFILCLMGSFLAVALVSRLMLPAIFTIEDIQAFWEKPSAQIQHLDALVFLMILNGTVFIIASLIFSRLVYGNIPDHFKMSTKPDFPLVLLGCLSMMAVIPFVGLLSELTLSLPWPESLQAKMEEMSSGSHELQSALLNIGHFGEFVLILITLAVLPALGEELLVRGSLQQLLLEERKSAIGAIILSALFFAAMHLQYENFLGIFTYGVMLGLFYYWSGNLWVSIIAHFFNNATIVTVSYLFSSEVLEPDSGSLGMIILYGLGSLVLGGLFLILFHRRAGQLKMR